MAVAFFGGMSKIATNLKNSALYQKKACIKKLLQTNCGRKGFYSRKSPENCLKVTWKCQNIAEILFQVLHNWIMLLGSLCFY